MEGKLLDPALRPNIARVICFSDIDGTIVHYPQEQDKYGEFTRASVVPNCHLWVERRVPHCTSHGCTWDKNVLSRLPELEETGRRHKILKLPASTTGVQGMISVRTLTDLAAMRSTGTALVLLTGARTSTLLARLPFLPAADAYASENGGRLFFPHSPLPTAALLSEDMDWRARHNAVAGPSSQEHLPAAERRGTLWDCQRQLTEAGWVIDCMSYTTAFRVKMKGRQVPDLVPLLQPWADQGLRWASNMGHLDVFPETSGKAQVAKYLLKRLDGVASSSFLLCDDANDMRLADLVDKVFVPSVADASVEAAAKKQPDKFFVARKSGTLGTEEVLTEVENHIMGFVLG